MVWRVSITREYRGKSDRLGTELRAEGESEKETHIDKVIVDRLLVRPSRAAWHMTF